MTEKVVLELGKMISWNERGFGFVAVKGRPQDVWVHASKLCAHLLVLASLKGQKVWVRPQKAPDGRLESHVGLCSKCGELELREQELRAQREKNERRMMELFKDGYRFELEREQFSWFFKVRLDERDGSAVPTFGGYGMQAFFDGAMKAVSQNLSSDQVKKAGVDAVKAMLEQKARG